jgi:dTMP kinase
MKKDLLIVIEGIDGSGKTTQIELLKQYLASQGLAFGPKDHEVETISFPRYEDNLYGQLIRRYLEGEFGRINEVNPYLIAQAYAGDRALAKPLIESLLHSGKLVIANRYVSSSKAHLGANLPEDQREEFMGWIDKLEFQTNGIPKEDLTILLDVDPKVGKANVSGKQKDIHEDDFKHLQGAAKIYLELSKAEPNWKVVDCMEGDHMKSKEGIHRQVVQTLTLLNFFKAEKA